MFQISPPYAEDLQSSLNPAPNICASSVFLSGSYLNPMKLLYKLFPQIL